jgi:SPP1 gp7 family putative phage head morphogenesis protein
MSAFENLMATTKDATPREMKRFAKERFRAAKRMENDYLRSLKQVVKQIDNIIKGMSPRGIPQNPRQIEQMLQQYAQLISPWARVLANKMITEISEKNVLAWNTVGNNFGRSLRKELETSSTGQLFNQLLNEQVILITSLPLEAAQRVHKLTSEALITSARPKEIAAEIMKTGEVTKSRATCIARTEVSRTASKLTEARSSHLGITHYIWRTSGDSDVRHSHKEMDGKVIAWDTPPTLSDGSVTHAGQIYNCRCYPEPIIPED